MNWKQGEWMVERNDVNKPYKFRIETDKNILAGVYSEANANLIAAAPKMYKALKVLYATMFAYSLKFKLSDFDAETLNTAKQALAKAEGKP